MKRLNTAFDGFLDNVLIPLLAGLALVGFLCSQAKASDFEIAIVPEAQHMSHTGQHAPFTTCPTGFGANMVGVGLQFDYKQLSLSLVESYNLSPSYHVNGYAMHGEIVGKREEFSLRVQYKLRIY